MTLKMPGYIDRLGISNDPIQYPWDDKKPMEAHRGNDSKLSAKISDISGKGIVALSIGFTEWIAWRLSKHSDDQIPFQVIEASWASIVDLRYMHPLNTPGLKLERIDWQGPVRGPLCDSYHLLSRLMDYAARDQAIEEEAVLLSNLALYVLKDHKPFKEWRRFVIQRLTEFYPWEEGETYRSEAPIPREVLDPDFDYKPEMAKELIGNYIEGLDYKQNPYLRSPEEMARDGFEGTPYKQMRIRSI